MSGPIGRGSALRQGNSAYPEAIDAVRALDTAIRSLHPSRYADKVDATRDMQAYLDNINSFLGRPATQRVFPVDYDALVHRIGLFATRGLLEQILLAVKPLPVMEALMKGVLHEHSLRMHQALYDPFNLGREVKTLTVGLLDFLNRVASTRPQS